MEAKHVLIRTSLPPCDTEAHEKPPVFAQTLDSWDHLTLLDRNLVKELYFKFLSLSTYMGL